MIQREKHLLKGLSVNFAVFLTVYVNYLDFEARRGRLTIFAILLAALPEVVGRAGRSISRSSFAPKPGLDMRQGRYDCLSVSHTGPAVPKTNSFYTRCEALFARKFGYGRR